MRWWKKGILFILSNLVFASCDATKGEVELEKRGKDWSVEIVEYFILNDPIDEEAIDQLIHQLNSAQDSLTGYPRENTVDHGNWIISAEHRENFAEIVSILKKHPEIELFELPDLMLWRIPDKEGKLLREVSLSPHPTMQFSLMMRQRGQE